MKNYLKLMRIKHYLKNVLIFIPLLFNQSLTNFEYFINVLLGFFAFSFIASVVYIINDINDVEKDRLHPTKCNRPIAKGVISIKKAYVLAIFLCLFSMLIIYFTMGNFFNIPFIFLTLYLILNVAYSMGLKNIPLVDLIILTSGFIIRILFGAAIIGITISNWLYLTVMAMSFYLGLGKRRNEILKSGNKSRKVLKYYTENYLDKNMYMSLTLGIIFYSLWTIDNTNYYNNSNLLIYTIPLLIIIMMKYNLIIEGNSDGDPVEVLLSSKTLILLCSLYAVVMFLIIYGSKIIGAL